jgi:hypothetical protein
MDITSLTRRLQFILLCHDRSERRISDMSQWDGKQMVAVYEYMGRRIIRSTPRRFSSLGPLPLHLLGVKWRNSRSIRSFFPGLVHGLWWIEVTEQTILDRTFVPYFEGRWEIYTKSLSVSVKQFGPPLWSSGQSSWLQIRRPGFDSRHYQIFWKKKKKKEKSNGTTTTKCSGCALLINLSLISLPLLIRMATASVV